MKKIRVGSIGIGGVSRHSHLTGIAKCPDLELVAVCDIREEALQYAKETYGIPDRLCFTDYHDLINCPEVDVVDITTPNYMHFEIALAAAKAKKSFALEKPMVMDVREAEQLAEAVRENGVKSMICFSYRYKAAARYARDLIMQGAIGDIYHVDMQYYQSWGLPLFERKQEWRYEKQYTGTGALGDLGSHALDLVGFVTGHKPTKLTAHLGTFVHEREKLDGSGMGVVDVDDFSNWMAELDNGAAATFRITRFAFGRGNYQTMDVYGSKGAIRYALDHERDVDEIHVCIGKEDANAFRFTRLPVPEKYTVNQMQSFADILLGKTDGLSATVEDGLINMRQIDAIVASSEEGVWKEI